VRSQISKSKLKILKLPDRQSRFVPADNIHHSRDGGNRTGGIEPEEERERQRDRQQIELYKSKKNKSRNIAIENKSTSPGRTKTKRKSAN
jgi:hypothetical protein